MQSHIQIFLVNFNYCRKQEPSYLPFLPLSPEPGKIRMVYVDFAIFNFTTVDFTTVFSETLVQIGFQHEKYTPFVTVCCLFRHTLLLLLLMAFLNFDFINFILFFMN